MLNSTLLPNLDILDLGICKGKKQAKVQLSRDPRINCCVKLTTQESQNLEV